MMQPLGLFPPLDQFHQYWTSKLRGRAMPSRADIDPTEIKALLPHILLTDVVGDEPRFRYRLVGTEIVKRFGYELTGHYVDEAIRGDYGRALIEVYEAIVRHCQPFFARSRVVTGDGVVLGSSRLMLPLSEDGVRVNMIFTGQIFDFDVDRIGWTMWMAHDTAGVTMESDPILLADHR